MHTAIGRFTLPLLQGVTSEGKPLTRAGATPTLVGKEIVAPFVTTRTAATADASALSQDVLYATAIGGGGYDWGNSIVVDNTGAAYIAGVSYSARFSSQSGLNTNAGYDDAFVAKLNSNGALAYAVFLGGSGADGGSGIAVDASGAAYLTGTTNSADWATPYGGGTCEAGESGQRPCDDVAVVKVDAAGNPVYARFFGGAADDYGTAMAVNASGEAYVTGSIGSAVFTPYGGACDAFVVKLSAAGTLTYARALGGSADDAGSSLALDASGAVYITGYTASTDFLAAYGEMDAFVVKLALGAPPTPTPTTTVPPTRTPTPTVTRTATATPTVTPNVGRLLWIEVAGCNLDRQHRTPQGNFIIWYTRSGRCAIIADPGNDYPQNLGSRFEDAHNRYAQMQYQLPSTRQPYQVFVVPINVPIIGPLSPAITFSPEYAFMTNDARSDAAIPAHEFFHAIQWTYQQTCPRFDLLQVTSTWYDNEDLRWWMEATATWAQRQAVPADRTYINPIRTYLNLPWQHTDTRLITERSDFGYSPLFPFYLIERVAAGNNGMIRATWEEYQRSGNCGAMKPVIQRVLGTQNPPTTIERIFPDYTEANYFLAYAIKRLPTNEL